MAARLAFYWGMGIGTECVSLKDIHDTKEEEQLLYTVATKMQNGDIAVIQEEAESSYNKIINQFDAVIVRYHASDIQGELDHARQVQKDLEQ